jgi:hypothetical protein
MVSYNLIPGLTCLIFYLLVLFVAEISRKLVEGVRKKNAILHTFLIELIGTAQMCTCVYENGLVSLDFRFSKFYLI